jgi:hypothetical protein
VTTSPAEVDHSFGADTTPLVGLPSAARRVRAVDGTASVTQRERNLSPTLTRTAQHGDVDLYDLDAIGIDSPVLLYDLDYDSQGDVDVGVWDSFGTETITDSGGIVRWQRVFDPAHDFAADAAAVIENGLLRLWINAPDAGDETAILEAERWDDVTESWSTVDLPAYATGDIDTDWQPAALTLTQIGQTSVHGQLEFAAVAGTNAGDVYPVDVHLDRGWEDALITIPPNEPGPIPADLETLLAPIASMRVVDPEPNQRVITREEVDP